MAKLKWGMVGLTWNQFGLLWGGDAPTSPHKMNTVVLALDELTETELLAEARRTLQFARRICAHRRSNGRRDHFHEIQSAPRGKADNFVARSRMERQNPHPCPPHPVISQQNSRL